MQHDPSTLPDLAEYLARHDAANAANVPTPVIVDGGVRSLSSILYGAPPPEPVGRLRRRMADLLVRCVTNAGAITRDDLLANFTSAEIEMHFARARKLAGLHRLGDIA